MSEEFGQRKFSVGRVVVERPPDSGPTITIETGPHERVTFPLDKDDLNAVVSLCNYLLAKQARSILEAAEARQ